MPIYNPGTGPDEVVLKVDGISINIFTSYTIRKSILTQPAQFNMQLGFGELKKRGETTKDLIKLIPINAPFQLYVNNCLQQSGHIDGITAGGQATEIQVHGRDNMALLHDAYLLEDVAFENDTYKSLVEKVLQRLEITENVFVSDEANLKITTGIGIPNYENPNTIDQVEEVTEEDSASTDQPTAKTTKIIKRSITAKVAETYYQFLQRQFRRAGLFLWAGGDGSFILSEPNDNQPPIARILRRRGQSRNAVNVLNHVYRDDITHRYTSAHVYGRSRGRKNGRAKALGEFVDDIMFNQHFKGKDTKPISFRDVNVSTQGQAEFFARRKLAEFNRQGFQLQYTVTGHTAPNLFTGLPSTWSPNTMVEIDDDELGIRGNYYLEEVVFTRPPTTTTLTLMNPAHLIFQSDDEEAF